MGWIRTHPTGQWRAERQRYLDRLQLSAPKPVCTDERVGPHNRCSHPIASPAGYSRCEGDPSCPYFISHRRPERLCPAHQDRAAIRETALDRLRELMEER